ncbi:MAG: molybdopterin-dependent oxidoreductase, partial [Gammaproteobacteria bacterium]|nr:molybdopterin-dependent oxidoreductase [Gammaproteobacteria bacterium]
MKRRTVLKLLALSGGGIAVGVWLRDSQPPVHELLLAELPEQDLANADQAWFADAWVRLLPDDSVIIQVPSSEMGQGVMTALPMLVAEEMDADWSRVRAQTAPVHPDYRNPINNKQSTGGSASIRGFYLPLREAGAAIREALLQAAARHWGIDAASLTTENSVVRNPASDLTLRYGELLDAVSGQQLNSQPKLKSPEQFRLLNRAINRLDTAQKINGSAVFGQDVQVPDMQTAVIARCPVFQGSVANFDAGASLQVAGVERVTEISSGIAVIARHFWAALEGRKRLHISWNEGSLATQSDAAILREMRDKIDTGKIIEASGNVDQ